MTRSGVRGSYLALGNRLGCSRAGKLLMAGRGLAGSGISPGLLEVNMLTSGCLAWLHGSNRTGEHVDAPSSQCAFQRSVP
jgi:hypothetical protein